MATVVVQRVMIKEFLHVHVQRLLLLKELELKMPSAAVVMIILSSIHIIQRLKDAVMESLSI